MKKILLLVLSILFAWAIERIADAILDWIIEWLKRKFD